MVLARLLIFVLTAVSLASCYIPISPGKAPVVVDPDTVAERRTSPLRPHDAIVLFDGNGLSEWTDRRGRPARWRTETDYIEVVPGTGSLHSRRAFRDVQLHLEWATPVPARGSGQGRGNSGVFLMGRYEVQVLDSYANATYPTGQAAAIYGQFAPRLNASRPPGKWQTYDITFQAPRFSATGKLLHPAVMTVYHNGVLVQDRVELKGPTGRLFPRYRAHPDSLPLVLQDHRSRVRYRNVWLRELKTAPSGP